MALSQHQLDKAKEAIEYLSSLPTGSRDHNKRDVRISDPLFTATAHVPEASPTSEAIKKEKGEPKM